VSQQPVLYSVQDNVAQITLNRPENRNSMTPDVLAGFREAISRVRADPDLRCVVITGSGRSFCAGADFRNRPESGGTGGRKLMPWERPYWTYENFLAVLDIEVPTIAAMNGHAIGGGFGLGLVCDLRVANREARYGANFVRLGLHPGMATTYFMPRLIGLPKATELLLTGRIISGEELAACGLANYAAAESEVLPKALGLAREIAACAPIAVRMAKKSIYRNADWDPRRAAEWEAQVQSRTLETEDAKEGVAALLEKREPVFKNQ
jgi:enoyl-CoA hydratase